MAMDRARSSNHARLLVDARIGSGRSAHSSTDWLGTDYGGHTMKLTLATTTVGAIATVESHIANILTKLGLYDDAPDDPARALAVLAALRDMG
jgi:hypothetical protein